MLSEQQLQAYYDQYGKDKVDEALAYLNYKKGVSELPKKEDTYRPILYVFRHGQTTDNQDMLFSGWRDVNLTQKGIEQAQTLAEKLKDKKIDLLVASDQIRAIKTMELAMSLNESAKGLTIIKEPRFKEKSYGDYQGKSKLQMQLEDPQELLRIRRSYTEKAPNGESVEDVVKRVNQALDEIIIIMKENNINVAISCHGNSIRGIRQRFEDLSNEETAHIETPLAQDYAAYEIV